MASLDEFSREQVILAALRTTGRVAVNELAARFGVSSVTVRKDLDALERRALLRRVRGGAVSLGASDEGSFEARFTDSRDRKQAIARAAAAAVRDGDVLAIDSSTTAYYAVQRMLADASNITFLTGLLPVMDLFSTADPSAVSMVGYRCSARPLPVRSASSSRPAAMRPVS